MLQQPHYQFQETYMAGGMEVLLRLILQEMPFFREHHGFGADGMVHQPH